MIAQFSEIAHILLEASPMLATALGSPLSGIAVSLLSHAFGVDPNQPQDLVAKVLADVSHGTSILQALEAQHGDIIKRLMDGAMNLESAEINVKLNWK